MIWCFIGGWILGVAATLWFGSYMSKKVDGNDERTGEDP